MKPFNEKHTPEKIKQVFRYDEETGNIYWKIKPYCRSKVKIGDLAGSQDSRGYVSVRYQKIRYAAHRLIWCMFYNEWPKRLIDHKDLNPSNNKISNLRLATFSENAQNSNLSVKNNSGVKGVSFDKLKNKWIAKININLECVYRKSFLLLEEATHAVRLKRIELHKEFSNHG